MRWKGFVFIGVVVGIIFLLSLIFTDQWLEDRLEEFGSGIVGAQVDIDDLDIAISEMKISLSRLQVTDKDNTMKNVVETGEMLADLEFWPLLSGKVIIDSLNIKGIRTNTDRESDGRIEETFAESTSRSFGEAMSGLEGEAKELVMPQLEGLQNKVNVDSVMAAMDLGSIQKMDSMKTQLTQKYEEWDERLKDLDVDEEIKSIETEINKIDLNKLDDPVKLQQSLTAANKVKTSVEKLDKTFNEAKKDLYAEYKNSSANLKNVDDWIAEDYAKAMKMAQLPDFSMANIGKLIFGEEIANRFIRYLGYAGMARDNMDQSGDTPPKEAAPARLKGQDIYFYQREAKPDWWIKSITLEGITETEVTITGIVKNLVSDQRQIAKPTTFNANGRDKEGAEIKLLGEFNYLEAIPREAFTLSYTGFSLANIKLADSPYIPANLSQGRGDASSSLNIAGDGIEGTIDFKGTQLKFSASEEPKDRYVAMIHSAFNEINTVDMKARIFGTTEDIKFDLNSNIDRVLKEALQGTLNKEVENARKEITDRIDKEVSKYRQELDEMAAQYKKDLDKEIKKYEDDINEELKIVEDKKKEIQKAIDKQTGDVQKKIKDLIKF